MWPLSPPGPTSWRPLALPRFFLTSLYGVSISLERATYQLVKEHGWFGVNFMEYRYARRELCGTVSMREVKDKVARSGLTPERGPNGVPLVKEAYRSLECEVVDERELGDHVWFTGLVRSVVVRKGLKHVKPLLYMGGRYVTVDPESEVDVGYYEDRATSETL